MEEYEIYDLVREMNNLPKILYHYCTSDVFEKIITEKSFKFSDIKGTNDYSENLTKYMSWLIESKHIFSSTNVEIREKIIKEIKALNHYKLNQYFIACFSSVRDDLGLWRTSYGDNGKGICIGFNPEFFTKNSYRLNPLSSLGWTKIEYDIAEQKKIINNEINRLEGYESKYNEETEMIIAEIADNLKDLSLCIKHRAFNIENEWRLICNVIDNKIIDDRFSKPNFEGRGYAFYSLKNEGLNPIKEILIGVNSPFNEQQVQKKLKNNGFNDVKIKTSKIPYIFSV